MRRSVLVFLTASLLLHAAAGGGGAWLAKRAKDREALKPVFAGETFDIAPVDAPPRGAAPVFAPPLLSAPGERAAPIPHPPRRGEKIATSAATAEPLTFGALGDRSATSLIVAISRGFTQAASTDPVWRTVPLGDAGSAVLEVDLEEDGTLARWSLGPGASTALRQAMVRTMAFIGGRAFVAHGAVTKLRLAARVSADAVRDGSDAVYAIHSEHDGPNASAYFSLASGRRIDLVITPVKSE